MRPRTAPRRQDRTTRRRTAHGPLRREKRRNRSSCRSPATLQREVRRLRPSIDLAMVAAGAKGAVLGGGNDGPTAALTASALLVRTKSEGTPDLAASNTGVTWLRLSLEASRQLPLEGGAQRTPSVEFRLHQDGGDAETGLGADIGAGLTWADLQHGLKAEIRGRGLLTHEDADFRERGFAASLAWNPTAGSDFGPSLTLHQVVGASSTGGLDALFSRGTMVGLAANGNRENAARRLEMNLGLRVAGGRKPLHRHAGNRVRVLRHRPRIQVWPGTGTRAPRPGFFRSVSRGDAAREREQRSQAGARNQSRSTNALVAILSTAGWPNTPVCGATGTPPGASAVLAWPAGFPGTAANPSIPLRQCQKKPSGFPNVGGARKRARSYLSSRIGAARQSSISTDRMSYIGTARCGHGGADAPKRDGRGEQETAAPAAPGQRTHPTTDAAASNTVHQIPRKPRNRARHKATSMRPPKPARPKLFLPPATQRSQTQMKPKTGRQRRQTNSRLPTAQATEQPQDRHRPDDPESGPKPASFADGNHRSRSCDGKPNLPASHRAEPEHPEAREHGSRNAEPRRSSGSLPPEHALPRGSQSVK